MLGGVGFKGKYIFDEKKGEIRLSNVFEERPTR